MMSFRDQDVKVKCRYVIFKNLFSTIWYFNYLRDPVKRVVATWTNSLVYFEHFVLPLKVIISCIKAQ